MNAIAQSSLLTLEAYARERPAFRARVMAHKKDRTLAVGPNITLIFEDELTVRYQIQEMLRIERTFEPQGIRDELDVYGPLVPDGTNLKATMMIEYEDPQERARELARLIGVEDRLYIQVQGAERRYAVADEDLERENDSKTSSVHFLRFEFETADIAAFRAGRPVALGVDHPNCAIRIEAIPARVQAALARDFRDGAAR